MARSLAQVDFGAARLFTDAIISPPHPKIEVMSIDRISSSVAYSNFLLNDLVNHVETSHCLVSQWDGHVIDATHWRSDFLDHDYIGASWPQFADGHDVGNGGFSLRSRRLMQLCCHPDFKQHHPEDIAIGRTNRIWLEEQGMRFASRSLADLFSAERSSDVHCSFGYHGAWLMPQVIGISDFWRLYQELDERSTIRHDFAAILKQIKRGRGGLRRAVRLIRDQMV